MSTEDELKGADERGWFFAAGQDPRAFISTALRDLLSS